MIYNKYIIFNIYYMDINYNALPQKTTATVPWDFVIITDSEDAGLVKIQDASLFVWPTWSTGATWATGSTWATGATGSQGIQWIQGIQGVQWDPWTGDMTLASIQTNSWLKTFLNGTFGLRNIANTITSFFTNSNTVARTYTFPDKDWTVAMTADITWTNSWTNTGDQTSIVWITWTMAQFDTAVTDWNIVYQSQALWTPASWTLTNCTWLPLAWVVDSTTESLWVGSLELWHWTDTTLSRVSAWVVAVEWVTIPTISSTSTLTNKRNTARTWTTTSSATPTINTDNVDFYSLTAQTEAITSFTTNLSWTPTEKQTLWIAITGTAAIAITWGASFEASTVALPTTTVTTARLDVWFVWNTVTSKWRIVAVV